MTSKEKAILNIMQEGIPVTQRPYKAIGKKLGMTETEVYELFEGLKDKGLIRRFGGIVDINALGIRSTLVGLKVSSGHVSCVAEKLCQYEGVTHNYERDDAYNLWFTFMASSKEEIDAVLNDIQGLEGVEELLNLPSKKKFKTKVVFKF